MRLSISREIWRVRSRDPKNGLREPRVSLYRKESDGSPVTHRKRTTNETSVYLHRLYLSLPFLYEERKSSSTYSHDFSLRFASNCLPSHVPVPDRLPTQRTCSTHDIPVFRIGLTSALRIGGDLQLVLYAFSVLKVPHQEQKKNIFHFTLSIRIGNCQRTG